MVRKRLEAIHKDGQRHLFRAKVKFRCNYVESDDPLVLLTDIWQVDEPVQGVSDHLWVRCRSEKMVGIKAGDFILFEAKVRRYTRGNGTVDFGLRSMRDVRKGPIPTNETRKLSQVPVECE